MSCCTALTTLEMSPGQRILTRLLLPRPSPATMKNAPEIASILHMIESYTLLHRMKQFLTWARCWVWKIKHSMVMPSPVGTFAVKRQVIGIDAIWDRTCNTDVTITVITFVTGSTALLFRYFAILCLRNDVDNYIGSKNKIFSHTLLHHVVCYLSCIVCVSFFLCIFVVSATPHQRHDLFPCLVLPRSPLSCLYTMYHSSTGGDPSIALRRQELTTLYFSSAGV